MLTNKEMEPAYGSLVLAGVAVLTVEWRAGPRFSNRQHPHRLANTTSTAAYARWQWRGVGHRPNANNESS
jgi:hypothetical protein